MYKFFLLLNFVVITSKINAQNTRPAAPLDAAKYIEVSDDNHDFGNFVFGTPLSYSVKMKNISKDTLFLTNIIVSCGCTTPHYKKGAYAPGSDIDLTIAYNGRNDGLLKKTLSVLLEDNKDGQIVKILRFQGTGIVQNKVSN
ncbi:MAG: DUF1573 domain-containing protein [Arachidicoccus sp.]|nr:DUF1573 domain-containing protein [Arachidicoccus sp.]